MSHDRDINEIRRRIQEAQSQRDAWQRAGNQEKYLESYFALEALEAELDRLRQLSVRSTEVSDAARGRLPIV